MAAHRSASMAALDADIKAWRPGVTIGWIGDRAHQLEVSDHNADDTAGVKAGQTDADHDPEVRAEDPMIGPAFTAADAWALVGALVDHAESQRRLLYVIFMGLIWSRDSGWEAREYHGDDRHDGHMHISGYAGDDENGAPWGAVRALGDTVSTEEVVAGLGANAPYESPGVHTTALAAGEGTDTSVRRLVEYLIEHVRYGKPFAKRDGTVLLPHVRVDEIATPLLEQLAAVLGNELRTSLVALADAQDRLRTDIAGLNNRIEAMPTSIASEVAGLVVGQIPALNPEAIAQAVARRLFGDRLAP